MKLSIKIKKIITAFKVRVQGEEDSGDIGCKFKQKTNLLFSLHPKCTRGFLSGPGVRKGITCKTCTMYIQVRLAIVYLGNR